MLPTIRTDDKILTIGFDDREMAQGIHRLVPYKKEQSGMVLNSIG